MVDQTLGSKKSNIQCEQVSQMIVRSIASMKREREREEKEEEEEEEEGRGRREEGSRRREETDQKSNYSWYCDLKVLFT